MVKPAVTVSCVVFLFLLCFSAGFARMVLMDAAADGGHKLVDTHSVARPKETEVGAGLVRDTGSAASRSGSGVGVGSGSGSTSGSTAGAGMGHGLGGGGTFGVPRESGTGSCTEPVPGIGFGTGAGIICGQCGQFSGSVTGPAIGAVTVPIFCFPISCPTQSCPPGIGYGIKLPDDQISKGIATPPKKMLESPLTSPITVNFEAPPKPEMVGLMAPAEMLGGGPMPGETASP